MMLAASAVRAAAEPQVAPAVDRKAAYVRAVVRGAGYLPWQDRGISQKERIFRQEIEQRKDGLLGARTSVSHPALLGASDLAQARKNITSTPWGRRWFAARKQTADYIVQQPAGYVERMIPRLTPLYPYGFTCPHCVGERSQEATGTGIARWSFRRPDEIVCTQCGHVYPSEQYPETATLVCPRRGQTFHYYENVAERQHRDDRSGRYAWHWVGYPIHVSFSGLIRHNKVAFMMGATRQLAYAYTFTGDPQYARRAIEILDRLADCYPRWLYHDYWDSVADCDPMYAAYHDRALDLEWKRHLCGGAFRRDSATRASLLQTYWGAGRVHPSTDAIGRLVRLVQAYDLLHDARDEAGRSLWKPGQRERIERDLILEYLMGAEPFVGGPGRATNVNNKSPRVYQAMAAVARCLGLQPFAETALAGYRGVREESFLFDGFSTESPAYTNMYLSALVYVPEFLHGLPMTGPAPARGGILDVYGTDPQLRRMFRAMVEQLLPDGRYLPLSDSSLHARPSSHLVEIGLHRYPDLFRGRMAMLYRRAAPTDYAIFHLDARQLDRGRPAGVPSPLPPAREGSPTVPPDDAPSTPAARGSLPERFFSAWMTAILRHGTSARASTLTLAVSPAGGHRHKDHLGIFYAAGGRTVLGDLGYVGDMPVNRWLRSTRSHNLVVVDRTDQAFAERTGRLHRMVTTPWASVVEASSTAYAQCRDYRRLVALIKGPPGQSFAVDVFHVEGGGRHEYRLFSEVASSDAAGGALVFDRLSMPEEPPLPRVGASLAEEDIFGLRDIRAVTDPPPAWSATWKEADDAFRVWVVGPCDRVEASNGPGQETRQQAGRRVRYLNVMREGSDLRSTFVVVHEPAGPGGTLPIARVERLEVPAEAGSGAVALRIEASWGTYVFASGFERPAHVAGFRFQGAVGLLHTDAAGRRRLVASEANLFQTDDGFGFRGAAPVWSGSMTMKDRTTMVADHEPPRGFAGLARDARNYVLASHARDITGWPVEAVRGATLRVERFPLVASGTFRLPNLRLLEE